MSDRTDKKTDEPIAKRKPLLSKKRMIILGCLAAGLLLAFLCKPAGMGKKELLQKVRDNLILLQTLRSYGPLGWLAFVCIFVASLILCLPITTLLDAALGNIYGPILGTTVSLLSKLLGALGALLIGRHFRKYLNIELPDALKARMTTVRTHPFTCLLFARMTPCSTGVKNYAFALLPSEDVPIPQYSCAIVAANVFFTISICTVAANADNLMSALDHVLGGH